MNELPDASASPRAHRARGGSVAEAVRAVPCRAVEPDLDDRSDSLPMRNLADLFLQGLDAGTSPRRLGRPDGPPPLGRILWTSGEELADSVATLARGLEKLGLARGERVAILSENCNEWALVDWACLCSGLVVVPIYPTLAEDAVRFVLEDSGARALFVSGPELAEKVRGLDPPPPELEHRVLFQGPTARGERPLAELLQERGDVERLREGARSIDPGELASLVYTSGTTGRSKGVMLTHRNLTANVDSATRVMPLRPDDLALSFLPLSHIFERTVDYSLWWSGSRIVHCPRIEWVAGLLRTVRPTFFAGVPRLYEKVHQRIREQAADKGPLGRMIFSWAVSVGEQVGRHARKGQDPPITQRPAAWLSRLLVRGKVAAAFGGRVRICMSGGAYLRPELCRFFWGMDVPIHPGYGMTEAAPILSTNRTGEVKCHTVGPPLPGVELRFGEDDEILARGANIMRGYWRNPEATERALDGEWLRTGDLGRLDPDGHLVIIGRKKEILVTSTGKNVVPAPIEESINRDELVEDCMLVGDDRKYVAVLLAPNREALQRWAEDHELGGLSWDALLEAEGVQALYGGIVERASIRFSDFERPKRFALLPRPFLFSEEELTATGKLRRSVVAEHFAEAIEGCYR